MLEVAFGFRCLEEMGEELGKKAIVVVNDLRTVPVLAALKVARMLARAGQRAEIIVSRRLVDGRDYGDFMPTLYKVAVMILLRMCEVKVVAPNPETSLSGPESMGVISSLYSITNDSAADLQKYPRTYAELVSLSKGAKEIVAYIQSEPAAKLYLFNGRTASSYPVSRYAHARGLQTLYYEYASSLSGFNLYPCPPHASGRLGDALMRFYREAAVSLPKLFADAQGFEQKKINNVFTAAYTHSLTEQYDVAMFLGSDHEYTALDPDICGMEWRGNLDFCRRVVTKYGPGKRYAVRCHPNQRTDRNWRALADEIARFCKETGADYFGPDSGVSSHDLIRNSSIIATDFSSIAVDAVLLGKDVDIFGETDLKRILGEMNESSRRDASVRKKVVAEMFGLYPQLFFVPFNWLETMLCVVFTKVNVALLKVYNARAIN